MFHLILNVCCMEVRKLCMHQYADLRDGVRERKQEIVLMQSLYIVNVDSVKKI